MSFLMRFRGYSKFYQKILTFMLFFIRIPEELWSIDFRLGYII